MTELLAFIKALELGTVSGWTLVAIALFIAWKMTAVVPILIQAWEQRSSGVEERLQAAMKATLERYDKQLKEADEQHQKCLDGQERLRVRITKQDTTIATQNETIAKQSATIITLTEQVNALKTSNVQQQIARVEELGPSANMARALASVRKIGGTDGQ